MKSPDDTRRPTLVSLVALGGRDENALLAFAASLSRTVEHPLRSAILDAARERDLALESVEEPQDITGQGVAGSVAGRFVVLGDAAFFASIGVNAGRPPRMGRPARRAGATRLVGNR